MTRWLQKIYSHYVNASMKHTAIIKAVKMKLFR